jgi:hypothetical protein
MAQAHEPNFLDTLRSRQPATGAQGKIARAKAAAQAAGLGVAEIESTSTAIARASSSTQKYRFWSSNSRRRTQ